jgi:hypothetical protein
MDETPQQRILKRAAKLMGEDELARRLGVPRHLLDAWIRGHATMTERKLLLLADELEKFGKPEK